MRLCVDASFLRPALTADRRSERRERKKKKKRKIRETRKSFAGDLESFIYLCGEEIHEFHARLRDSGSVNLGQGILIKFKASLIQRSRDNIPVVYSTRNFLRLEKKLEKLNR